MPEQRAHLAGDSAHRGILRSASGAAAHLSRREHEVLALIGEGRTNRQIADTLVISLTTAERHVHNILTKLECTNRTEAAALVARARQASDAEVDDVGFLLDSACPYPGLRAFEAEDADNFVGREVTIAKLSARLASTGMVSIVGASGSGKSSLVRAGLLPALQGGALPGSSDWDYLLMTPGTDPVTELASRLASIQHSSPVALLHDLEADPRALDLAVRQLSAEYPPDYRLLLVVDQFEELFTMCGDRAERQQFADLLHLAAQRPRGRLKLIIAVRSDFYGECAGLAGFAEALESSHALLGRLMPDESRSVIEKPAERAGLRVEPGLTERILGDLGESPGALPLLAHALLECWQRREGRTLTVAGYLESGGIREAIARTAERVFGELGVEEQLACRNLFLRLTELGEGTEETRRRVRLAEVSEADSSTTDARGLIARLAAARLLTVDADSVEVAHEALIREWPRLREWLSDDREGLRLLRHITQAAQSWERLGRDAGELYRGTRLSSVLDWAGRMEPELNPLERAFLDASRALHERDLREAHARLRRLRLMAAVVGGLFAVAAIGAGLAATQWRNANGSRDRADAAALEAGAQRNSADQAWRQAEAAALEATLARLETEIPLLLDTNRGLAFLLAAQANKLMPGARSTSLMNRVLAEDPRWLGRVGPIDSPLALLTVSTDGKYLATKSLQGLVELRDASTHALISSVQATPGLPTNSLLAIVPGPLLLDVATNPTGRPKVSVFRLPSLEQIREFTWDNTKESFAGLGLGSTEMAFLFGPAPPSCCRSLRLLDVRDGAERTVALPPLDFAPAFGSFVFDLSGTYLGAILKTTTGPAIAVLDAKTFELINAIKLGGEQFGWFDFAYDGSVLLTATTPGYLELWDPRSGARLGSTQVNNFYPGGLTFGPSGRLIVAAIELNAISPFSLPTLRAVGAPYSVGSSGFVYSFFGAGEKTFFSLATPTEVEHWALDGRGLTSSHNYAPGAGRGAVSPDGAWFVKQSADGAWARWSLPGLALLNRSELPPGPPANNSFGVTAVSPAVSADGRYIATPHTNCPGVQTRCSGSVVLWDSLTGARLGDPILVPNRLNGGPGIVMAFHPGLPLLAVGGPGNEIQIWSFAAGVLSLKSAFTAGAERPILRELAFVAPVGGTSPVLAIWPELNTVSLWDVGSASPAMLARQTIAGLQMLAVTPAGAVVVGDGNDIAFYGAAGFAASAKPEPFLKLSGATAGATGAFARLSFSADGRWLALAQSAVANGRVSVWNLETKAPIGSSFNWLQSSSPGRPDDAFMAPDGSYVVSSNDRATVVWSLNVASWFEKVCFAAGRNLTEAEWTKYFPGREYAVTCDQWPARSKT